MHTDILCIPLLVFLGFERVYISFLSAGVKGGGLYLEQSQCLLV